MRKTILTILILMVLPSASVVHARDEQEEPPIIKSKDYAGKTVRSQTWETGRQEIDLVEFSTLAARYYAWRDVPRAPGSVLLGKVSCAVRPDGTIRGSFGCDISCPELAGRNCWILSRLVQLESLSWPNIREISQRRARRISRSVTAGFGIDTSLRPDIDFEAGDELPWEEILEGPAELSSMDYPGRALRKEAEGVLTLNCKVLDDQSIACADHEFRPEENREFFVQAAAIASRRMNVKPTMPDGRSSVGMRFLYQINFVIP